MMGKDGNDHLRLIFPLFPNSLKNTKDNGKEKLS